MASLERGEGPNQPRRRIGGQARALRAGLSRPTTLPSIAGINKHDRRGYSLNFEQRCLVRVDSTPIGPLRQGSSCRCPLFQRTIESSRIRSVPNLEGSPWIGALGHSTACDSAASGEDCFYVRGIGEVVDRSRERNDAGGEAARNRAICTNVTPQLPTVGEGAIDGDGEAANVGRGSGVFRHLRRQSRP